MSELRGLQFYPNLHDAPWYLGLRKESPECVSSGTLGFVEQCKVHEEALLCTSRGDGIKSAHTLPLRIHFLTMVLWYSSSKQREDVHFCL